MKRECTWCGKKGEEEEMRRSRDAANLLHFFHPQCWKEHCDFLNMKGAYAPKEKR
jgi:hypothetical protein